MTSERIQRQIERLLDEAEAAVAHSDWATAKDRAQNALMFDEGNADAKAYLAAAGKALATLGNAPGPMGASLSETTSAPPQPAAFANGRYQVKRFLGAGGKKRVYLAHDTRLDRDVAFALIKTDGLDAEGRERIEREAQAMGKLGTHPHIVSVFDMGEEPASASPSPSTSPIEGEGSGTPYLVAELMAGGDVEGLLEKAEEHRLPIERAVELAQQVCQGLQFAHTHGLVHRDLKPGNVWLTADGTAKIGDFGLAVALDRSRLTQAGMMVGTVAYMPPEQALGGEVTPRSDLYSVGCMLYEMVCGRPPFVGDESVAIVTQHLNTPPVAPTWHRSDCPSGLEALILRLLEKDATKRPENATAVRAALEVVGGSPLPGGEGQGQGARLAPQPASDNPLYRRTFVGREAELKQLQAAFDGALSGQGALAMVVGEPGIGKTALCEQLATYAAVRGGKALVGHSYEEGSVSLPYLPFVEALRSYVLAREPDALRGELGSGATDVARIVSEIRDKVAVEPRPDGDPEDDRWRLYQAVTGFLRNAANVQPLMIVLEDLHWADRGTLDYLVHLSRNLQGARLLVVGTYRDVEVDRSHPLSAALADLRRESSFRRLALRGLTPDEVHRMLNNLTTQDVRWSLAEAVHRQTEGNPLFIQEVMRYLVEEHLITREGGRWERTGPDAPEMSIPEGLRDVIGKRLSRLSEECNRVLAMAAVIGRDFALDILKLTVQMEEEPLVSAIEEALHIGVLEEETRPGLIRYRFTHAFFRQTLYEELSAPRRLRLHQQVARALESHYGSRLEDHAAELAEHYAHSTEAADLSKAVSYSDMAARRALGVFAYGEAVRLLDQAIEVQQVLDPDDHAKQCDLLLKLASALVLAGEPARVVEAVAPEALTLAEALEDTERATGACMAAMNGITSLGIDRLTPTFHDWLERLQRFAAPGSSAAAWAMEYRSMVFEVQDRYAEEREQRRRAIDEARRLGDRDLLWYSVPLVILRSTASQGDIDEQQALFQELNAQPREGVASGRMCWFLRIGGDLLLAQGERSRADELWKELDELAARTRDPRVRRNANWAKAAYETLDGQLEKALSTWDLVRARLAERGLPETGAEPLLRGTLRALLWLGREHEAISALEHALEVGSEAMGPWTTRGRLSLCFAHGGREQDAQALLNEFVADFGGDSGDDLAPAGLLGIFLETAVLVEDPHSAALLARKLSGLSGLIYTWSSGAIGSIARLLAGAARLQGELGQARAYYDQALDVCQRVRFRPEIAQIRLELSELLLQHYPGEKATAIEHLDFAVTEFRAMNMQPALERALRQKGLLGA